MTPVLSTLLKGNFPILVLAFLVAALSGWVIVLTRSWHGHLSMDGLDGVQKFHLTPTPRIGGIPVVLGLWAVIIWCGFSLEYSGDHDQAARLLRDLLIASLPAFVFGLLEDVTKRVGVVTRLVATMASGVLAWWLTGMALDRVDVWGLDLLLASWWPLSVAFTAFAVGGVANALNIVDGFNGLASSTAFWACVGYALMALRVNDSPVAVVSLTLAAAMLGFFVINWPFGRLFLGDGGSYFTGFSLAWLAVELVERHPQISAFSVLVVLAYPITEVLFSMYRRKSRQDHLGHPDRLHFHSLLKRRYVARWFKGYDATARNSIAGIVVGTMTLPAAMIGFLTMFSVGWSVLGLLLFMGGYIVFYRRMVRHRW